MNHTNKSLLLTGALIAAGCIAAQAQVAPYAHSVNTTGGSHTYDGSTDTYIINGCGSDVWGTSDQFHFVYLLEEPDTNFDYMVKMESFAGTETSTWMKAGIMVREGGDTLYEDYDAEGNAYETVDQYGNARCYCFMGLRNDASAGASKWITHWRDSIGGNVSDSTRTLSNENYSYPSWIRIRRIGNTYLSYFSSDAKTWTVVDKRDTSSWKDGALGNAAFCEDRGYKVSVGMWATSHTESGGTSVATFSEFQPTVELAPEFVKAPPAVVNVADGASYTLDVKVSGYDPFTYTLKKGDKVIYNTQSYENTFSYTLEQLEVSDSGDYTLEVANDISIAISDFTLNVEAVTDDLAVLGAGYNPIDKVVYARFNKIIDEASLTDASNYSLTEEGGASVAITSLTPSEGNRYVILGAPVVAGGNYTITVSNITAADGSKLSASYQRNFTVMTTTGVKGKWYDANTVYPDSISDLVSTVRKSIAPTKVIDVTNGLDYNAENDNYFGLFCKGYLIPPETGEYRFALSSDDQGMFFLSTDSDPQNLSANPICQQTDWSTYGYFTKNAGQQSGIYNLVKGELYYFEAYLYEISGGEVFQVAWSLPSEGPLAQIPDGTPSIGAQYITDLYNVANTVLNIDSQPESNVVISAGSAFDLNVKVTYGSDLNIVPTYQWYVKNDSTGGAWVKADGLLDVSGSTTPKLSFVNAADYNHDGVYRLDMALAGKTNSSQEIKVTITSDTEAPTAVATGHNDMNKVVISFSEFVIGYDEISNYSIDGLEITGVSFNDDGTKVILLTSHQEEGKVYTVKYSNIYDYSGYELTQPSTFTAFVWSPGYSLLESFGTASSFDTLFETTSWMFTETPYNANPQLGRYLEITTDTFNKDNCVERISGYIVPEETGIYDFTGSCDDDYKLWISSDEWVENLSEEAISWENGWNSSGARRYDWSGATGTYGSTPIQLIAGKKYYYVVSLREGGGGDFVSITWHNVNNPVQANNTAPILTGNMIGIYANPDTAFITVTKQPESVTAMAGDLVTFSVAGTTENEWNAPVAYQWYVAGHAISGATDTSVTISALPEYDGQAVYCELSVPGKTVKSNDAIVSVSSDDAPLAPYYVMGAGNEVIVLFDKEPDHADSVNVNNYKIEGVTVKSARLGTYMDAWAAFLEIDPIDVISLSTIKVVVSVKNLSGKEMVPATLIGGYTQLKMTNVYNPSAASGVGAIGTLGYADVRPGSMTLNGWGTDVEGAGDACFYLYEEVDGDFDFVVHITNITAQESWEKGGIMYRTSLDFDAPMLNVLTTPSQSIVMQRAYPAGTATTTSWPRLVDGNLTLVDSVNNGNVNYPNAWLRLKREGNVFTAYRSSTGINWTMINQGLFSGTIGDLDYTMPKKGYIGLFNTAHNIKNHGIVSVADYNSKYVYVEPTSDPNDFVGEDILKNGAAPGLPGSYYYNAATGEYNIQGSGSDLRGTSDGCYFVWQKAPEGDFDFRAKLNSVVGTSTGSWIKAGLMAREALGDGSNDGSARLFATQAQRDDQHDSGSTASRYWTAWRQAFGASIDDTTGTISERVAQWPHWQRITRVGTVFTAYVSEDDGLSWIVLEEVDTAEWEEGVLGADVPLYIGMWVTANSSTSNDAYANFTNVSIKERVDPPTPTDLVLSYDFDGENLTLRWDAASGASLEVAPTADSTSWTILEGELVGGAYQCVVPVSQSAGYYRLTK